MSFQYVRTEVKLDQGRILSDTPRSHRCSRCRPDFLPGPVQLFWKSPSFMYWHPGTFNYHLGARRHKNRGVWSALGPQTWLYGWFPGRVGVQVPRQTKPLAFLRVFQNFCWIWLLKNIIRRQISFLKLGFKHGLLKNVARKTSWSCRRPARKRQLFGSYLKTSWC